MTQSCRASLMEASLNVVAGYAIAVLVQLMVFPIFGLYPTLAQNLKIGLMFTAASVLRSYAIRRLFERWRPARQAGAATPGTGPAGGS